MTATIQYILSGLAIGGIYALVALGFALIYRATNVVNFAQGDFAMLGAFAMVVLAIDLELPYWLSILITLVLLVGFVLWIAYGVALGNAALIVPNSVALAVAVTAVVVVLRYRG